MGIVKALSLNYRVNLLGLASALLLFYTALSNKPWWTITGGIEGERTFSAEVSPFNIAVEILGKPATVPILPYLNLAARLSILLAAATILLGSLLATKPWSKPLISVRGLVLPILFLCGLFIGLSLAGSYVGVNLPLTGEFTLAYAIPYGELNIATETPVSAALTGEYWIALAAGIISVLAKTFQGKITSSKRQSYAPPPSKASNVEVKAASAKNSSTVSTAHL